MARGNLLLVRGAEVLHRGVAWTPAGRRTISAWAYRPGGRDRTGYGAGSCSA